MLEAGIWQEMTLSGVGGAGEWTSSAPSDNECATTEKMVMGGHGRQAGG
jgi:hypothetical protein